jgi:hypothetical protein
MEHLEPPLNDVPFLTDWHQDRLRPAFTIVAVRFQVVEPHTELLTTWGYFYCFATEAQAYSIRENTVFPHGPSSIRLPGFHGGANDDNEEDVQEARSYPIESWLEMQPGNLNSDGTPFTAVQQASLSDMQYKYMRIKFAPTWETVDLLRAYGNEGLLLAFINGFNNRLNFMNDRFLHPSRFGVTENPAIPPYWSLPITYPEGEHPGHRIRSFHNAAQVQQYLDDSRTLYRHLGTNLPMPPIQPPTGPDAATATQAPTAPQ